MPDNSGKSTVLVVGATGFLGMEICRQLVKMNKTVKALVRLTSDPEKVKSLKQMGIETISGDLKDPDSLGKACKGVTSVISSASSTFSRQVGDSIESVDNNGQLNLIQAASDAGVEQFIYISFLPMQQEFPLQTAKRIVEKNLKESKMHYTILQPGFFMEVWLSPAVGFNFPESKATIYGAGKNKLSWISLKDVAAFAAASLDNRAAVDAVFQLGGPIALSPLEVVEIFQKKSGSTFAIEYVPEEMLLSQKKSATDSLSESFAALMLAYADGNQVNMKEILKVYPVDLTSVTDYVQQIMHVMHA